MISSDDKMRPTKAGGDSSPSRWTSQFKGHQVEVVIGWIFEEDRYRAHVYVTPKGGERVKLPFADDFATENQATQAAFRLAEAHILG